VLLATPEDVERYVAAPRETARAALRSATRWIETHADVPWTTPPAVEEATALLAAVFVVDPAAMRDDSRVPDMVRQMIRPWS
jgi:hypothetical protein